MRRLLICILLTPMVAFAQAPATAPKAPARAPAPAAQKPAAPAAGTRKPAPAAPPLTDDQKIVYALGLLMQRSLAQFDLGAAELEVLKRALTDASAGKPAIYIDEWGPKVEAFANARSARAAAREKTAS